MNDLSSGESKDVSIIQQIFDLFEVRGRAAYGGEAVSQAEHALQAAWAAEQSRAKRASVVAALLHDVGHLLHGMDDDCAEHGIDDQHEELGARWVQQRFGPAVSEPIRLHVAAKRYLCATQPAYLEHLSPASLLSLQLQGGAFTPQQAEEFRLGLYAEDAVALRLWDDEAKISGLETPPLEHFRPDLEALLIRHES